MEEYTKKVEDLNDSDVFTSWIAPKEDAEMILNTEKHISYDEGHNVGYGEGKSEGIDIGLEQGKLDEKLEIAKNMLEENIDTSIISKITDLTKIQIAGLK